MQAGQRLLLNARLSNRIPYKFGSSLFFFPGGGGKKLDRFLGTSRPVVK